MKYFPDNPNFHIVRSAQTGTGTGGEDCDCDCGAAIVPFSADTSLGYNKSLVPSMPLIIDILALYAR
jgi:hypothetical protein